MRCGRWRRRPLMGRWAHASAHWFWRGGFAGSCGPGASADAAARAAPDPTQPEQHRPFGRHCARLGGRTGQSAPPVGLHGCPSHAGLVRMERADRRRDACGAPSRSRSSRFSRQAPTSSRPGQRRHWPGPPSPAGTGSPQWDSPPGGRGSGVTVAGAGPGRGLGPDPGPGPCAGCWVADLELTSVPRSLRA
jgi:hypothetical protein